MSHRNIQPGILFFSVRRCLSIMCFYDFQDSFSLQTYRFEMSEYIDLEGLSVFYNVIQKSVWAVWKRLVAEDVFLSKMEVTNRTLGAPTLTTDYDPRYRIYVIFDAEYDTNISPAVS
jgi:hypothetical protein